ncbi:hypothetical protein EA58_14055 [Photobacterium galatheae]|uniref:Uncharacterized protein n=2 Tax=Photobacterium galatheae TaxID=1654360 RepID=A0A066RKL2_9GAMM|nr:hypothetical protein EA58_14055 [Photobacterium galatheae]
MKFNKINKEVIALSSHFSEGVKSKGILGNIYGYVKFLEKEQEEVNQALKLALTEHERRNDEYKKLKARSLGIEHFIDKCEGMIAAMDDKIETELLDAWFISTQSTKSKKI